MRKPAEIVNPRARAAEGFRDTGYDASTALCDIVDNSIAASATRIDIYFHRNPLGDTELYIADNGIGMPEEKLKDAMAYGSAPRDDPKSLGKFGLGLKTASTAMARCTTVVTRDNGSITPVAAQWDLDHVRDVNAWELMYPDGKEIAQECDYLEKVSPEGSGTVVSWKKIDRILKKSYSDDKIRQEDYKRTLKTLRDKMELVYHKFLDPQLTENPIEITLNEDRLNHWNPYGDGEGEVSHLTLDETIPVSGTIDGKDLVPLEFTLKAYVFKPAPSLSEIQQKEYTIGKKGGFRQGTPTSRQGIYVYRENRLIAYNTWLRFKIIEPHANLVRVDFSFDHKMDQMLQLDTKKSQVILDAELRNAIRTLLAKSIAEADQRSRRNQTKIAVVESGSKHAFSNTILKGHADNESFGTSLEPSKEGKNGVQLTNNHGTQLVIDLGISDETEQPHVVASDEMTDPLVLWEFFYNSHTKKQALRINAGHEFYKRVYGNLEPGELGIQGMDSLLWSLMQAELGLFSNDSKDQMRALRHDVASILSRISVANFNEPKID